jgi:hypothetical protein
MVERAAQSFSYASPGVAGLNRNGHVLEARLGCLRVNLLKPLGRGLIVSMTLDEVIDLYQGVHR